MVVVFLVQSIVARFLLIFLLKKPLNHLIGHIKRVAGGDYGYMAGEYNLEELQSIMTWFNLMAGQVESREKELQQLNLELEDRVVRRLRGYFADVPDVEFRVVRPVLFSSKAPIIVEVQGDDLLKLKTLSRQAVAVMENLPSVADVETSLRTGAPEIQVTYHRDRLATYGLNIETVARQVRDMVQGFEATRFNMKDRRVPIVARLDEPDRAHVEDIGQLIAQHHGSQLPH